MRIFRTLTFALLGAVLGAAVAAPGTAQQAEQLDLLGSDEMVDRVVAVVGDSVILQSQLQERILQLQAQGVDIPDDSAARDSMRRDLLTTMVNEQLVVQAAAEDTTITVNSDRVDQIVQEDIQQRIQAFGSESAMRQALKRQGMSMSGFRDMIRTDARRQQLRNQYLQQQRSGASSIEISQAEMRAFFEENRERLGDRPATITFEQIILQPRAADSARAAARRRAETLLDSLRNEGASFEELARRHSDDPGSREQGGDLGWFRRGTMVPAFEDVVFSLREGGVSDVVETQFGFHIIKVERIRGAERRARHILIRPDFSNRDVEATRTLARNLKEQLQTGASIDSLQTEYGDAEQPDSMTVTRDRLGQLPPGYQEALRNAEPGQVLGPVEWGPGEQMNLALLKVEAVQQSGEFSFQEVQGQIRQRLQRQKLMEQIFADLREQTHVEIRL